MTSATKRLAVVIAALVIAALALGACEEGPPRTDVVVDVGEEVPVDLGTGPERGRSDGDIDHALRGSSPTSSSCSIAPIA